MVKQICVTTVIIIATATTLLGQTTDRRASRNQHSKQQSTPAAELTQMETQWHRALEKADLAALDRLLGAQWFITNGSGAIITKSEVLEALRTGEIKFIATIPAEIKVHVYNHAAVVTKRSTDQTMYGSNPGGGRYQMTDMFVKLDGRWQCIATHASRDLKP